MPAPVDPVKLPIFSNPWVVSVTLVGYLLIVLKVGPRLMKNRMPFDLRGVIKVYNIMQIVYNGMLGALGFHLLFVSRAYRFSCFIPLPMDHELKDRERFLASWYIVNKFVDLVETVFFVLRKKNRQISFLHVFHHVAMVLVSYLYYYFLGYGGIAFPLCFLNVVVHVIMYTYYYLSSISPEVQKSLWWKKYITLAQLTQFALMMIICIYTLMDGHCSASKPLTIGCGLMAAAFTVLFCQFYFNTYIRTGKKKSKKTSP
ncbi:hypothetical protein KR084_003112 [Drosophila pseudotakahashii]|nr:hypothetical protein KR084_003112 [Drosophila pseudotakahashii]